MPSFTEDVQAAVRKHPIVIDALRLVDNHSVKWQEFLPYEHRRLLPPRPISLTVSYDPNDPEDSMRYRIDRDVLKPENLTQNAVTPRVARLAKGWTAERLRLLGGEMGPRRRPWDKELYHQELEAAVERAKTVPKSRLLSNHDGTRLVPDRKARTKWMQPFRLYNTNYNVRVSTQPSSI